MPFSEWIQSLPFVTQAAHMGWCAFIVLALAQFVRWGVAVLLLQLWCIPKELLWDWAPWGENHGSPDWMDLAFYELGALLAVLVLGVKALTSIRIVE